MKTRILLPMLFISSLGCAIGCFDAAIVANPTRAACILQGILMLAVSAATFGLAVVRAIEGRDQQ